VPPCTILQAACATIASIEHFDPVTIGEGYSEMYLRSGQVGYANPTSELLKEAAREFGGDCWTATVISIGGNCMPLLKDAEYSQRLEAVLKNADAVHQDVYYRLHQLNVYFRFDVPHHSTIIGDARSVYHAVQTYKSDGRTNELINKAIMSIRLRQQVKKLSELSEYYTIQLARSN
jgi:hypothetical protein